MTTDNQLDAMRHSLAHIMASAIKELWPSVKLGVGPVVANGFYYDLDLGSEQISENDFDAIEKKMRSIIKSNQDFEQFDLGIDEAIDWAKRENQVYKLELLNDLKRSGTTNFKDLNNEELGTITQESGKVEQVSFYQNGDFVDLCRGPHVSSTGQVGEFKLMRVAGAYWRGNENNAQMQRIYGVGFATDSELKKYLEHQELARERDHRKLGKELDLFTFSDLVGSGLPLFTPKGTAVKNLLSRYSTQLRSELGFKEVSIPHVTKKELYEKSGHWAKFGEELFLVNSQESSDEMVLKPMNCPHHTQIYASRPRSYRELPVLYQENTVQYRDEKSGELHGLSRVRSISIDDNHAFVQPQQISGVASGLIAAARKLYSDLGLELKFRLSFRDDSEGYLGDTKLWSDSQKQLEQLAKENNLDYFVEQGEAAFYGPKIDFIAIDALEREWQLATVQLDFVQPQRFELTYIDENNEEQTPVMIHAALLGSAERFMSVYIEHTNGRFPFWLAPEQVRILTINDQMETYVERITTQLSEVVLNQPVKYNELRWSVDNRNQSLGKKIRDAQGDRIPIQLIVGPKDEQSDVVSYRHNGEDGKISLSELKDFLTGLAD